MPNLLLGDSSAALSCRGGCLATFLYGRVSVLAGSRATGSNAPARTRSANGYAVNGDRNGNGALSFDEWAVKSIEKFQGADRDRSGWLTPAEYATTAPPPPKRKRCSC